MSRWTPEQLAEAMSRNPQLRLHQPKSSQFGPVMDTTPIYPLPVEKPATRRKYRNVPTIVDNIQFDSKKEAARYRELRLLERAEKIQNLMCQPRYRLEINEVLICHYAGDFSYTEDGQNIVEDCKGMKTQVYKLKAKLMKALHGVTIRET